eukprot:scaffold524165_cov28-Prasinocladus_malaysianus.AAC.1
MSYIATIDGTGYWWRERPRQGPSSTGMPGMETKVPCLGGHSSESRQNPENMEHMFSPQLQAVLDTMQKA